VKFASERANQFVIMKALIPRAVWAETTDSSAAKEATHDRPVPSRTSTKLLKANRTDSNAGVMQRPPSVLSKVQIYA
jgi:hypothetical protein